MAKRMELEESLRIFRRKAAPLVVTSDKEGIKKLFADLTAAAAMEEGSAAFDRMEQALRDALQEPHRRVRRDLFSNL